MPKPCRQDSAGDRRGFPSADTPQRLERIAWCGGMGAEPGIDDVDLAGDAVAVDARPRPDPVDAGSSEAPRGKRCRSRRIGDPHLAHDEQVTTLRHGRGAGFQRRETIRIVHRRGTGEIRCRPIEIERDDRKRQSRRRRQGVNRGTTSLEICDHLPGDLGRIGADTESGDAMVPGEDDRVASVDPRPFGALPAGDEAGDILEPAERARRLGELALAGARSGFGGLVDPRQSIECCGEGGAIWEQAHSATNPGGGTRTMKCPFTPCGHSRKGTRPSSLAA